MICTCCLYLLISLLIHRFTKLNRNSDGTVLFMGTIQSQQVQMAKANTAHTNRQTRKGHTNQTWLKASNEARMQIFQFVYRLGLQGNSVSGWVTLSIQVTVTMKQRNSRTSPKWNAEMNVTPMLWKCQMADVLPLYCPVWVLLLNTYYYPWESAQQKRCCPV